MCFVGHKDIGGEVKRSPEGDSGTRKGKFSGNPLLLLTPLKYVFENIMKNGVFALLEQMLHCSLYFQKYSKLNLIFS